MLAVPGGCGSPSGTEPAPSETAVQPSAEKGTREGSSASAIVRGSGARSGSIDTNCE